MTMARACADMFADRAGLPGTLSGWIPRGWLAPSSMAGGESILSEMAGGWAHDLSMALQPTWAPRFSPVGSLATANSSQSPIIHTRMDPSVWASPASCVRDLGRKEGGDVRTDTRIANTASEGHRSRHGREASLVRVWVKEHVGRCCSSHCLHLPEAGLAVAGRGGGARMSRPCWSMSFLFLRLLGWLGWFFFLERYFLFLPLSHRGWLDWTGLDWPPSTPSQIGRAHV